MGPRGAVATVGLARTGRVCVHPQLQLEYMIDEAVTGESFLLTPPLLIRSMPSCTRRMAMRTSMTVMSATALESTPGVCPILMPLALAAATSMWSDERQRAVQ